MFPKRRKAPKMNVREEPQIRCPSHLAWVRGHECAAFSTMYCQGRVEAAHARVGTDGGMSMKPGDNWSLPLCEAHHRIQHQMGERSFEARFKINMKAIAQELWNKSPAGRKYREGRSPAEVHQDNTAVERR